ncbi:hypothetical protein [Vreelandella hamiltonii]|uniref:Uncharacterized protein n=2 Tax=Halomonadaceae TaxID=28256 RepID=A0A8H9I5I6_9GAMM|nr:MULTISPECIES: hypothetical protein [Halomonas]GGW42344.1 hypothetical protein GCM10007157_35750 [Halomonas hamiltonii]GGW71738.1 hypothetical protein GCM10007158_35110 [Halomonas johnsoniae]
MKKEIGAYLAVGFFLLTLGGVAHGQSSEASVSTESNPGRMLVLSGGGGINQSFHHPARADFPPGTTLPRKELTSIEWQTTWYPDAIGLSVDLCYFLPNLSSPVGCVAVTPNSSGSTTFFSGQRFDIGSKVEFVYEAESATGTLPRQIENAGNDSVVFNFQY